MEFIAVRLRGGAALSGGAALLLVDYARRRRGREGWALTSVDAFSDGTRGETLLIARPAAVEVRLADYALPFFSKYFTD